MNCSFLFVADVLIATPKRTEKGYGFELWESSRWYLIAHCLLDSAVGELKVYGATPTRKFPKKWSFGWRGHRVQAPFAEPLSLQGDCCGPCVVVAILDQQWTVMYDTDLVARTSSIIRPLPFQCHCLVWILIVLYADGSLEEDGASNHYFSMILDVLV